ncbi:tetratricopeptide repeat protein [Paenibacillus sp. 1001270B_150601_E10]|uniref:tetratricopeptide repeat protein n=1 Tax=Paenibacillus sp. 1001270B_150601_E10 TaxID=2787079 RepID=UPI00189CF12E|nr:tetratricopeptide repeat protein [Paenibacillus sp. 1001270B_150601_E10]
MNRNLEQTLRVGSSMSTLERPESIIEHRLNVGSGDQQDPVEDSQVARIEALLRDASDYIVHEHYKEALQCAEEALALDPQYAESWFMLGQAHIELGQLEVGEAAVKRAIERDLDEASYYYELALLYDDHPDLNEEESLRRGFHYTQEAVKRDPDDYSYQFHLGYLYYLNDEYDEAAAIFHQLYDQWTESDETLWEFDLSDLRYQMAELYLDMGYEKAYTDDATGVDYYISREDLDEALNHYVRALSFAVCEAQRDEIEDAIQYVERSKQYVFLTKRSLKLATIPVVLLLFQDRFFNLMALLSVILIGCLCIVPRWKHDQMYDK